jgi:surface protein
VVDMGRMFYKCSTLTSLDLSKFNTAQVKDMQYMFFECSGIDTLDLTSFNTQQCTNFGSMFYGCLSMTVLVNSKYCDNLIEKIKDFVDIEYRN